MTCNYVTLVYSVININNLFNFFTSMPDLSELDYLRNGLKIIWQKVTTCYNRNDHTISMVLAAAQLYFKGMDVLHTGRPNTDFVALVNLFHTNFQRWLADPHVFDVAFNTPKELKVSVIVNLFPTLT